jgi:hypothetical protein
VLLGGDAMSSACVEAGLVGNMATTMSSTLSMSRACEAEYERRRSQEGLDMSQRGLADRWPCFELGGPAIERPML